MALPRPLKVDGKRFIKAPSESEFQDQFGTSHPSAHYLQSAYGSTVYYDFPRQSSSPGIPTKRIIFIHGICTPAVGLTPLTRFLQLRNPDLHIVLFDLWGHGLSDTPLAPHEPAIFLSQIMSLLSHMKWPSAHVVGYSFGAVTGATLAAFHPGVVESIAIIAPAGFLRQRSFTDKERSLIGGGPGQEEASKEWILNFLEGGPCILPENWEERARGGELIYEAIRSWECTDHGGHALSVVSMFRDGGIFDSDEIFATASRNISKNIAVLGELDNMCTVQDLEAVGWMKVEEVKGAKHGLVRDNINDVGDLLVKFWASLI